MTAADKIIETAEGEIGYLEKRSNAGLYDKTANAGSGNYTKYWAEIAPEYQAQPWCAAFVTWCMVQAVGRDETERLLRHYPYVYCPALAARHRQYDEPRRGAIVIFYRGGTFTHTGIVTEAGGGRFTSIEGNTSGGSTIIENGGAVCKKSYYTKDLPGTKFIYPDYSESEELSMTQYEELKAADAAKSEIINKMGAEIAELKAALKQPMVYNYIDENMPEWARGAVQWCVDNGVILGTGDGLGLDDKDLKWCTIIFRLYNSSDRAV